MSIKVINWVFTHSQTQGVARFVLVAIADCADHDGGNAYPSIETIMRKTGLSRRVVQRSIRVAEEFGELRTELNAGPGRRPDRRSNMYVVVMREGSADKDEGSDDPERGATQTPRNNGSGAPHRHPATRNGAPGSTERGARIDRTGRHTDALSVLDPSLEPKHALAIAEREGGEHLGESNPGPQTAPPSGGGNPAGEAEPQGHAETACDATAPRSPLTSPPAPLAPQAPPNDSSDRAEYLAGLSDVPPSGYVPPRLEWLKAQRAAGKVAADQSSSSAPTADIEGLAATLKAKAAL